MTYIDYLNRFNQWAENNDLPLCAVVLYYRLLDRFNRAGWPGNLRVDTLRLMVMSGCQSKGAAYRARDALALAGFIRYEKGSKGKPTTYFLSEILSIQRTESKTVYGTVSETESETVNGPQRERNKTKKKKHPPKAPQGAGNGFQLFWSSYPRKVGKAQAQKSWDKLAPDPALVDMILRAVERDKSTEQWRRDGGRYIPYPATWLNQCRWEDEPDTAPDYPDEPPPPPPSPEEDSPVLFDDNTSLEDLHW